MSLLKEFGHRFFDLSVDMFCICDRDGYFVDVSAEWERKLGWSKQELTSRPFLEFVHPDDVTETLLVSKEMITNARRIVNFRNRYRTKSGKYLWLDWRADTTRDDKFLFCVATDVTESVEQSYLMEKAQEVGRIGSWWVDVEAQVCHWSPMTYRIHEVPVGTKIELEDGINYYVEEHRQIINDCVSEGIKKNNPWDVILQILTKNKRRVWVRAIGWPVVENDKLVRLEGVFQDIDKLMRQEAKLQEKNNVLLSYETALNMHSIVARTDSKGRITYVNKKFCDISKYDESELIGKDHRILNSGHHSKDFFVGMWQTISSGRKWRGEICNRAKDGSLYWVDTSITPIADRNGKTIEYIAIRNDITARKFIEEKVKEEQQKSLAASRTKSQFLASMSHEIRTPMNGIIGMTELLKQEIESSKHLDKLDVILQCGQSLVALINDILDYSKADAGKMEVDESDFELASFLRYAVELLEPKAEEKGIHLVYKTSNIPEVVRGDKIKLGQILFNLIGNAIKFTEKGTVDVFVEGVGEEDIVIRVKDTGIGIKPEFRGQVFEPFAQDRTPTGFKGTGLGLAITRQICELLGGTIEMESTVGKGTEFTVNVPMRRSDAKPLKGEGETEELRVDAEVLPLKILVVEDNKVNQLVIKGQLQKLGYEPDIAENGRIACDALSKGAYDLILMDVHMPVMDGLDATREIRSRGFLNLVIVALTAGAFAEDQSACEKAGMNGFVKKPVTSKDLQKLLNENFKDRIDMDPVIEKKRLGT